MKNRDKDASNFGITKLISNYFFNKEVLKMKKLRRVYTTFFQFPQDEESIPQISPDSYFFRYITSFTSFTILGTSGRAPATKLGA
jgi:hypothetical protein